MNNTNSRERVDIVKDIIKMVFIYNALERGWTVKRGKFVNSFEFTKLIGSSEPSNSSFNSLRRSISEPQFRLNLPFNTL